jgi:ribonuclease HII
MLASAFKKNLFEAGCDEAGRGCLAGPVFAAAVIFPEDYTNDALNDSKKLSEKQRIQLKEQIINDAKSWAVASVDHTEIDEINILNASVKAMHRAIDKLDIRPQYLIIDGNRFHAYENIPHSCIIKGDSKYLSIAAASILAKTFRDEYMEALHDEYPVYNWIKNKGYPTKEHREAIKRFGISAYHRRSFRLLSDQIKLNFD